MSDWVNLSNIKKKSYTCGYCGKDVAPNQGFQGSNPGASIFICPNCGKPTYYPEGGTTTPKPRLGSEINGITDDGIKKLYNEARDCSSLRAYTATVLICRKILMNLAVQNGATEGQTFLSYIEFLSAAGYVPPNGKSWVDEIRKKGNEATHEIRIIEAHEATQILKFVEMLLRFCYEFPSMLNPSNPDVT